MIPSSTKCFLLRNRRRARGAESCKRLWAFAPKDRPKLWFPTSYLSCFKQPLRFHECWSTSRNLLFVRRPCFLSFSFNLASFPGLRRKGWDVGAGRVLISRRCCGHKNFRWECAFCSLLASSLSSKEVWGAGRLRTIKQLLAVVWSVWTVR